MSPALRESRRSPRARTNVSTRSADAKGARLRDLDSTNGTDLNGILRGASRELVQGDRFRVVDTELIFVDPSEIPLGDRIDEPGVSSRS